MAQAYVLNSTNPNDWDILALQEPWFDSFGNSWGTQFWWVVYPANFYLEGQAHIWSILLINTNLSTDCYTDLPLMHSDIIAVQFKSENGYLSLLNMYNKITNNNILWGASSRFGGEKLQRGGKGLISYMGKIGKPKLSTTRCWLSYCLWNSEWPCHRYPLPRRKCRGWERTAFPCVSSCKL